MRYLFIVVHLITVRREVWGREHYLTAPESFCTKTTSGILGVVLSNHNNFVTVANDEMSET